MQDYIEVLKKCPLFAGIDKTNLSALLSCLNAKQKAIKKEESVFTAGGRADYFGIVLEGNVYVHQEDFWGNRTILTTVQAGGIFGEAFCCAENTAVPVSVTAKETSVVLLVDSKRIISTCSSVCEFHTTLIRNLMRIIAKKNIRLTKKIEIFTKKSVRERVLYYLSECALKEGKNTFSIPFNRQELADYLSVERSALSNTLSKMRDEHIIEFEKNRFRLLD